MHIVQGVKQSKNAGMHIDDMVMKVREGIKPYTKDANEEEAGFDIIDNVSEALQPIASSTKSSMTTVNARKKKFFSEEKTKEEVE